MAGKFSILATVPYTYVDKSGTPVQGYRVTFEITQFHEVHMIYVPDLRPETVTAAIGEIIANREALAKLQ